MAVLVARIFALVVLAVLLPRGADAQLSSDWFGTWHLDVSRSTFVGPPPYVRGTWKVERGAGDEIVMTYHQVGIRGGVTHMEWKGPFDGSDKRMHGPDAVVTYAYRILGPRELQLVVKIDGRTAARSTVVLGEDGTVRATTENGTARGPVSTVTVYTRR
jgi:hypothetical protein